jgi:hypothetical protein
VPRYTRGHPRGRDADSDRPDEQNLPPGTILPATAGSRIRLRKLGIRRRHQPATRIRDWENLGKPG